MQLVTLNLISHFFYFGVQSIRLFHSPFAHASSANILFPRVSYLPISSFYRCDLMHLSINQNQVLTVANTGLALAGRVGLGDIKDLDPLATRAGVS